MNDSLIKGDKQQYFNQVKGLITEINEETDYCNLTIKVGHDNPRMVNFTMKRQQYNEIAKDNKLGDRVVVRFYISSRKKHDRWYTTASVLDIRKEDN